MSRPYAANYAIGFMFVIGINLLFQSMCALTYPDMMKLSADVHENAYAVLSISAAMLALSILLLFGVSAAHKATIAFMSATIVEIWALLLQEFTMPMDIVNVVLVLLSVASVALLLTNSCREYYRNYDFRIRFYD